MRLTACLILLAALAGCGGSTVSSEPREVAQTAAPPSPSPSPTASPSPTPADAFTFRARRIGPAVRARVVGSSWHEGCPVPLRRLRYVRLSFRDFEGDRRRGELIVHRDAVAAIRGAFERLYEKDFPIRRMRLVDEYGASDSRSIEADNTSAFNCRQATGSTRWSEHAYGRAIDVNPIENPYVFADGTTTHPASEPYLDRSDRRPGMAEGRLVRVFRRQGWGWGGTWSPARDYQHFSATGR